MKKLFTLFSLILCIQVVSAQGTLTFHDYSGKTLLGDSINFSQYAGKKLMIVNTASLCSFTPQYADLEALYQQYKQYNFEIIGFPCNDFFHQEPGGDSSIISTCGSYNVTFQMMSKVEIVTGDTVPVYQWLQRANLNGVQNASVAWNFNKFLVDENGKWYKHYGSSTLPNNPAIISWILASGVNESIETEYFELKSANPGNQSLDFAVKNMNAGQQINVDLYSTEGKWVESVYKGAAPQTENFSHSVSHLPSGMYFIRVQGDDFSKNYKYVIAK